MSIKKIKEAEAELWHVQKPKSINDPAFRVQLTTAPFE